MEKIYQLARKWGTRIYKRSCAGSFSYNGKTIALYSDHNKSKQRSTSDIIHDIAHFVVATPKRRKLPEFGLGTSPDNYTRLTFPADGMNYSMAQTEEELASVLGIYWEREIGLDWRQTYENHSWHHKNDEEHLEKKIFNFDGRHKFAERLRELRKRNII